jgi:hypothetical protein
MSYHDPSEIYVFRCPQCTQFISSTVDACRFCEFPITDEVRTAGAEAAFHENKAYRIAFYKKAFYIGVGIFGAGLLLLAFFAAPIILTGEGTFFYGGPILIAIGFGQSLLGLHGIYKEKRTKFRPTV